MVQLPELFHKIGRFPAPSQPYPNLIPRFPLSLPSPSRFRPGPASHALLLGLHRSLLPRPFPVSLLLLRALGLTSPLLSSPRSGRHDLVPSGLRHRFRKVRQWHPALL